ncbi:MAG: sulfurtransferase TusA family protein [Proteobacteria bacterium]|nr:sulfurtransferase TusA family protein [Pseudomonadota bacterium]
MPVLIDGRGLLPPEPLERTLQALETLPDTEELRLLVACHPEPLLFILEDNGYDWQETVHADGTHELVIRKTPRG